MKNLFEVKSQKGLLLMVMVLPCWETKYCLSGIFASPETTTPELGSNEVLQQGLKSGLYCPHFK
jgi:hypothetical protein